MMQAPSHFALPRTESMIDYVPHECGGDKCKVPGCRFTIKLSFVLEKAALVLEGPSGDGATPRY